MSLNQLLINGKIGEGLDIECKSVSTSVGSGSIMRGDLTVLGITDLQGTVTCEDSLTVVGNQRNYGNMINYRPVSLFSGNLGSTPISVDNLINGIVVIDSDFVGSFTMSLSNIIDAYLGNPGDGVTFKCTFINRSATGTTISSAEVSAQFIKAYESATTSSVTDCYFTRVGGVYVGLLN